MIQRLQSVYLFLAGFLVLTVATSPLVRFDKGEGFYAMTARAFQANEVAPYVGTPSKPYGVLFFTVLLAVLLWVNIFLFKNRKKQIRLCNYAIVSFVCYFATIAAYAWAFAVNAGTEGCSPTLCLLFPLLSLALTLLARRGIKRDEELVRAADRIR